MPKLVLESTTDAFDLDDILMKGEGVQAVAGASGFGLPDVSVQWLEGAGDGAVYRGVRVLPRDIDLPLFFATANRAKLQALLSRFARMMAGPMTLKLVEDDGTFWSAQVRRVGGGSYIWGQDTIGERELSTVVTLRAGDPFWTYSRPFSQYVFSAVSGRGLLKTRLSKLQISSSQAIGTMLLENIGDAVAFPVWTVTGPGSNFEARLPNGIGFTWTATLAAGETLIVDTKSGTVRDGTGANRYAGLSTAPRLFGIPPGRTSVTASMIGTSAGSSITCSWQPRKWMVI